MGAIRNYKDKIQLEHGLISDYISDIIVICSLIFKISLIVFSKVTLQFERKEIAEHLKNCQRSTHKN